MNRFLRLRVKFIPLNNKQLNSVLDPDGKFRTVRYTADKHTGFHADIITDGHSVHHPQDPVKPIHQDPVHPYVPYVPPEHDGNDDGGTTDGGGGEEDEYGEGYAHLNWFCFFIILKPKTILIIEVINILKKKTSMKSRKFQIFQTSSQKIRKFLQLFLDCRDEEEEGGEEEGEEEGGDGDEEYTDSGGDEEEEEYYWSWREYTLMRKTDLEMETIKVIDLVY